MPNVSQRLATAALKHKAVGCSSLLNSFKRERVLEELQVLSERTAENTASLRHFSSLRARYPSKSHAELSSHCYASGMTSDTICTLCIRRRSGWKLLTKCLDGMADGQTASRGLSKYCRNRAFRLT